MIEETVSSCDVQKPLFYIRKNSNQILHGDHRVLADNWMFPNHYSISGTIDMKLDNRNKMFTTVPVLTCAHYPSEHPALSVLHGGVMALVPAPQDVHAAAPLGGGHTAGVRCLPAARQDTTVIIRIDLLRINQVNFVCLSHFKTTRVVPKCFPVK